MHCRETLTVCTLNICREEQRVRRDQVQDTDGKGGEGRERCWKLGGRGESEREKDCKDAKERRIDDGMGCKGRESKHSTRES